jgi:hypothetical protein
MHIAVLIYYPFPSTDKYKDPPLWMLGGPLYFPAKSLIQAHISRCDRKSADIFVRFLPWRRSAACLCAHKITLGSQTLGRVKKLHIIKQFPYILQSDNAIGRVDEQQNSPAANAGK